MKYLLFLVLILCGCGIKSIENRSYFQNKDTTYSVVLEFQKQRYKIKTYSTGAMG